MMKELMAIIARKLDCAAGMGLVCAALFVLWVKRIWKLRIHVLPKLLKKHPVEKLLETIRKWLIFIKRPGTLKMRHSSLVAGGDNLKLVDQMPGSSRCTLVSHDGTDEIVGVRRASRSMNRREFLPLHPPIVEDRNHELASLNDNRPVVDIGVVSDHLDGIIREKLESKEAFSIVELARKLGINRAFVAKRFRANIIFWHNATEHPTAPTEPRDHE